MTTLVHHLIRCQLLDVVKSDRTRDYHLVLTPLSGSEYFFSLAIESIKGLSLDPGTIINLTLEIPEKADAGPR